MHAQSLIAIFIAIVLPLAPGWGASPLSPADHAGQSTSAVLVEPNQVTRRSVARWGSEGFRAVALVLGERPGTRAYRSAGNRIKAAGLDLYYWIEVGRSPEIAKEHPEWMASLGMHDDWLTRFPAARAPKQGEVAKAFPWVSINYQEAFVVHLKRVERLLHMAAADYSGILLNDLQGGPASCGCGNLQCRWATDYQVPATAAKSEGDAAARFVSAVQELAKGKQVVPVWTTECDEEDLPAEKRAGEWTTGYSGTVGCAVGTCPKEFARQWSALAEVHRGAIAILALHREFGRVFPEYRETTGWIGRSLDYLDRTLPKNGGQKLSRARLWVVVQGYGVSRKEEGAARQAAAKTGAGVVLVARTRIDQSYQPRVVRIPTQR